MQGDIASDRGEEIKERELPRAVTIPILPESVIQESNVPLDDHRWRAIMPTKEEMEIFKYAALDGRIVGTFGNQGEDIRTSTL